MADGTIKFDTELDSSGLTGGLAELADKSGSAMSQISQKVNSELGQALENMADSARKESVKIAQDAIAAQKLYESENERIQNSKKDSEALYIEQLKSNVERINELRDQELNALKTSYDLGIISTSDYFSRLEDFRDRYFEYGSEKWQDYTAQILEHNRKLAEEQQKALDKAAESVSDSIRERFEELKNEQDKLQKSLEEFGGISQKNTLVGDGIDTEFISLANIKEQNRELEEYCRLLLEVKERVDAFWRTDTDDAAENEKNAALRNSYFSQLRGMDIEEAGDFAQAILGVSEQKLSEYFSEYEHKQELAESISQSLFSAQTAEAAQSAAQNLGAEFSSALYDELDSLEGKFFSTGEEACRSFGDGFMASLSEVLEELSAAITAGAAGLGSASAAISGASSVENNTSYNIYASASPAETIRLLREQEELKRLMTE